ncbi:MAG: DNA topoisomerase IV subunit A [Planctomycetes bacterium]|nr:DNA topoisomerase IV subunit A [Planctomycetota bacterium]
MSKKTKVKNSQKNRLSAEQKLAHLGKMLTAQIEKKNNPFFEVAIRALSNVTFNKEKSLIELGSEKQKRYFFNVGMAKKFMQTLLVGEACLMLQKEKKTTSLRDLYYIIKHTLGDSDENTVDEQEESDECIEDLEVGLDELRENLNLFASNRGSMVGEITIEDAGDTIDLRRLGTGGWSIPSIVESSLIKFKKVSAKYILMVEKDAIWRRLNEDKYWRQHKCILMHGQGMAPRGVRRLLYRLANELRLPVYILTDNDPWGFYIYSVIKQGSINLAYESMRMAVTHARFLGLSSHDPGKFKLSSNVMIKLNQQDISRAKQILQYPWFQKKKWQEELRVMLKNNVKLELEALSSKGISFIGEDYIPKKIRDKEWLE